MGARARTRMAMVGGALGIACAHYSEGPPVSQTTTTGAGFSMGDPGTERRGTAQPIEPSPPDLSDPGHPANRIANQACERMIDCGLIGDGKSFLTEEACRSAASRRAAGHLARTSCPEGIDEARFNDCLMAVRFASCAPGLDAIAQARACEGPRLCAH